jgi:hypothetical protein
MRLYRVEDEVRLGLARDLRDWHKAGLLTADEEQRLRADVTTDLRRAGIMLRLGLAAFTVIAGAAAIGLVFLATSLDSEVAVSITAAGLGAVAFGAATAIVRRFRLYRYGVEEALALGAVGLWGGSAGLLASEIFRANSGADAWFFAMAGVTAGCAVAYRRFGFQYAAVGAVVAAALLPMASSAVDVEFKRLFAALVCTAAFVYTSRVRRQADDDMTRADAEVIRAAAAACAYLALNSVLLAEPFGRQVDGWYRWSSWLVTWLLPFLLGRTAVIERDPLLLRVAIATGLASLVSNKAFLGWPRQPWDPMLLGVLLVAGALVLRRWLSSGEGGERNGFTARQLVESEGATIRLASLASVAVQPAPTRPVPPPDDTTFSGGRSGGAGAGTSF